MIIIIVQGLLISSAAHALMLSEKYAINHTKLLNNSTKLRHRWDSKTRIQRHKKLPYLQRKEKIANHYACQLWISPFFGW